MIPYVAPPQEELKEEDEEESGERGGCTKFLYRCYYADIFLYGILTVISVIGAIVGTPGYRQAKQHGLLLVRVFVYMVCTALITGAFLASRKNPKLMGFLRTILSFAGIGANCGMMAMGFNFKQSKYFNLPSIIMAGYCGFNFGASYITQEFIMTEVRNADNERRIRAENREDENRQNRGAEIKLNKAGPQQTVVTKMMKNLDNYKYNEANEKAR